MNGNDKLRIEADRRRAALKESASAVSIHMQPRQLLDKAVNAFDPNMTWLHQFHAETKRNPFVLMAVVGSFWLLAKKMSQTRPLTKTATRRSGRSSRPPSETFKGDENGYNNDPIK